MTGSGRGTREVGGGADRWGPGVSGWARQLPGAGDAEARGCWAGRGWAERERVGLGRWLWCWAAGKEMAMGRMRGRGGMEGIFLFIFINKIFKLIFKRFLKSFSI